MLFLKQTVFYLFFKLMVFSIFRPLLNLLVEHVNHRRIKVEREMTETLIKMIIVQDLANEMRAR